MKSAALKEGSVLIAKMAKEFAALNAANSHEDAVTAWVEFLQAFTRLYNKLRNGSKGHPVSWTWSNSITNERRTDRALAYAKNARDAEEHGIAIGHAAEKPAELLELGVADTGDFAGKLMFYQVYRSVLQPIQNGGVTYIPPLYSEVTSVPVERDHHSTPTNIARYVLTVAQRWLDEAAQLPVHS